MTVQYFNYFQYNSIVILSYFFLSLLALFFNRITHGKSNQYLFSSGRTSLWNPLTYLCFFTHAIGHENWTHFHHNFLYILLIGPMIEEKYGSRNLFVMFIITALITGIMNRIFSKKRILGASGSVYMLILLSSLVNFASGKIPITFVLICLFFIVGEVRDGLFKKDNVAHFGHVLGAVCGFIYGFYIFH